MTGAHPQDRQGSETILEVSAGYDKKPALENRNEQGNSTKADGFQLDSEGVFFNLFFRTATEGDRA